MQTTIRTYAAEETTSEYITAFRTEYQVRYRAEVREFEADWYGKGPKRYGMLNVWRNGILVQTSCGPIEDFTERIAKMTVVA